MDYIGSKTKLNDWIFGELAKKIPPDKWSDLVFIDGCAGSCATSKYALTKGFKVISNDLFFFSSAIIRGFSNFNLIRDGSDHFLPQRKIDLEICNHIDRINSIKGERGFFFRNYSESAKRKFFTDENAMRIDAARAYIDKISNKRIREYILYISIEGLSAIMNTTGVQAAFLKKIKARATNPFSVKIQPSQKGIVKTYNRNILELLSKPCDILYVDPPYNNRQYGPNYHLYETFVRNDNPKLITDVTGLRNWHEESKSDFCYRKTCAATFRTIVERSQANLIMISYSSDGLLSEKELINIFEEFGNVKLYRRNQNRYRADVQDTKGRKVQRKYNQSELQEYLFFIEKQDG